MARSCGDYWWTWERVDAESGLPPTRSAAEGHLSITSRRPRTVGWRPHGTRFSTAVGRTRLGQGPSAAGTTIPLPAIQVPWDAVPAPAPLPNGSHRPVRRLSVRLCIDQHRQLNWDTGIRRRAGSMLTAPSAVPHDEAVCDHAEARWLADQGFGFPEKQRVALRLKAQDMDVAPGRAADGADLQGRRVAAGADAAGRTGCDAGRGRRWCVAGASTHATTSAWSRAARARA